MRVIRLSTRTYLFAVSHLTAGQTTERQMYSILRLEDEAHALEGTARRIERGEADGDAAAVRQLAARRLKTAVGDREAYRREFSAYNRAAIEFAASLDEDAGEPLNLAPVVVRAALKATLAAFETGGAEAIVIPG